MVNRESVKGAVYAGALGTAAFAVYDFVQSLPVLPQFIHDFTCHCITGVEAGNRYGSMLLPYPVQPIFYIVGAGGLLAVGRVGRFHEDWNSLKNFAGKIPSKISSEIFEPIKQRILRTNANYVAEMNYFGI
jgi:hypothetical protein